MTFALQELMASKCPNIWHDMLHAGKLNGTQVEVPDTDAQRILAACPEPDRITGLGDVVAMVAQPIARALDAALGTDMENCGGCGKRKAWLNEAVSFKAPLSPP